MCIKLKKKEKLRIKGTAQFTELDLCYLLMQVSHLAPMLCREQHPVHRLSTRDCHVEMT